MSRTEIYGHNAGDILCNITYNITVITVHKLTILKLCSEFQAAKEILKLSCTAYHQQSNFSEITTSLQI